MTNASPRRSVKAAPNEPAIRFARPDSFSERIYLDLRRRLQRSEIGRDQRLVDAEVGASYGASRMPAREALLRLVNEGYLTGTTRGFVIPELSGDDIRDIFEIRKLLEPRAAANAAREMDAAAKARLTRALVRARRAAASDDVDELILANVDFRHAWLGALGNQRLNATIARFVDHVQTIRLGTLSDARTRAVVLAGLEGLHEAFLSADAAGARKRMTRFVAAAERAYFGRLGREAPARRQGRTTP